MNCSFRTLSYSGMLFLCTLCATRSASGAAESAPPATPREFFNASTQKLRQGKLTEAETLLETVLASQVERFQSPALYNLGHVRFDQGVEQLKKGPAAKPTAARGRAAAQAAADAIQSADEALESGNVQKMVEAYLNGRGARRELKAATKAVKQAMETYGGALARWQRSSGDFKSAVELNAGDVDARQNADTVDRNIAKLVDSLRELQQCSAAMAGQKPELGEKLTQLKGKIPADAMPPGAAGDEEEDEDTPKGPEPGTKEGPAKEGQEMDLSPEQAGWLLDAFKLDSQRRLPMG